VTNFLQRIAERVPVPLKSGPASLPTSTGSTQIRRVGGRRRAEKAAR